MVVKVGQHQHCRNCGKAVPIGEDYCSEACRVERTEDLRRKKNQMYVIIFIGAIIVLLASFLPFFGGG